ncbi:MAG TPA: AAA family ATPase [Candidatus Lokiarchaeia archaeon]|nr:AAA family ATPase [Candidatus Lokiarchaeia archaeon]
MQGQLIILAGLPSSGKSTLAQAIKDFLPSCLPVEDNDILIVDPDELRGEGDTQLIFDPDREPEIRKQTLKCVEGGLKGGKVVIGDDLNYYQSMRHDLLSLAEQFGVPATLIFVSTPLETCLEWNAARNNKVPPEIIIKVGEKFDYFGRYAWDRPDFTVDPSKPDFSQTDILDELCKYIAQNSPRQLTPESREESEEKLPLTLKHRLDVESRRVVSHFLQANIQPSMRQQVLKLRKSLLQKKPQSLEDIDNLLEAFQASLDDLKKWNKKKPK